MNTASRSINDSLAAIRTGWGVKVEFPDDVATFYVTYERRVLSPGYTNSKLALDLYRRCVSKDTVEPLIGLSSKSPCLRHKS